MCNCKRCQEYYKKVVKCPSGKIQFNTQGEGWQFAIKIIKKGYRMNNVYKCPICHEWHCTSQNGNIPDYVADERNKILSDKLRKERKRIKNASPKTLLDVPREVRIARGKILKGQLSLEEQREAYKKLNDHKL